MWSRIKGFFSKAASFSSPAVQVLVDAALTRAVSRAQVEHGRGSAKHSPETREINGVIIDSLEAGLRDEISRSLDRG